MLKLLQLIDDFLAVRLGLFGQSFYLRLQILVLFLQASILSTKFGLLEADIHINEPQVVQFLRQGPRLGRCFIRLF